MDLIFLLFVRLGFPLYPVSLEFHVFAAVDSIYIYFLLVSSYMESFIYSTGMCYLHHI